MFTKLSLRLRIFLFFCLMAAGGIAAAAGALWFGWSRADPALPTSPFITALVAFAFFNTGLAAGIWLLFDEHVAKPIDRLSSVLRLRAHSGVSTEVTEDTARYLGDLAPAVKALHSTVDASLSQTAARVAHETERLRAESQRLTSLLSEIPIATILLNPAREIVLYDAQAAGILATIAPPRLKAPVSDYFEISIIEASIAALSKTGEELPVNLTDATGSRTFQTRIKALGEDGHMIFIENTPGDEAPVAPRPMVFDFDLISAGETKEIADTPLRELCYVPFDTETTGLSVERDDIIQIGAVRILNGRIVSGEVMNTYVDPGRPIPADSTKIHHISDADVAGAPDIAEAGRAFHHFARDAVLVAHNAPFDIGLLRRFQERMQVDWTHPVLDTVLLSAVVFGTNEVHTLDALCDRLAVTIPKEVRHTALGDAQATGEALVKLLPLLEGKGIVTFGDVLEETRKHSRLLKDLNG